MRKRGESAVLIGVAPSRERSINCGGYNAICVPRVSRRFRAEKRKAGTSVRRIKKNRELGGEQAWEGEWEEGRHRRVDRGREGSLFRSRRIHRGPASPFVLRARDISLYPD